MFRPTDIGAPKWVRCGFRDCFNCCLETEMLVTEAEAENIMLKTGYRKEDFLLDVEYADGFYQLRNVPSKIGTKCIFLSDKGRCTIYDVAPSGCKLYPLSLNLNTDEVVIDIDCRESDWFFEQTFLEGQVLNIRHLVSTLFLEADRHMEELGLLGRAQDIKELYLDGSEAAEELAELVEKAKKDEQENERLRKRKEVFDD